MPCLWELAALIRRYERCIDDGDALSRIDSAAAVECYRLAMDIKELLYEEAERFDVPLLYTGCWQDDLGVLQAFVMGGGWQ